MSYDRQMLLRTVGPTIRLLRREMGLTQRELADLVKVSRVTVSNWERGKELPHPNRLERIAAVANVDPSVFRDGGRLPEQLAFRRGMLFAVEQVRMACDILVPPQKTALPVASVRTLFEAVASSEQASNGGG